MEKMSLPTGWKSCLLETYMVKGGGSVDPSKCPNEQFDLYSILAYDSQSPEILKGSEIGSTKKIVQEDDVLLSRIVPHIQRSWVVGKDVGRRQIGSGEWMIFRGNDFIPKYMKYFLLSYDFHMKLMTTTSGVGGSLTRANPKLTGQFEIPLPPLPEQRAIVSKIEELLSDLENGKQQLQTTQEQLEIYRRSLILDGVTGKLTAKWRDKNPNIDNSEKIFHKIQEQLDIAHKKAAEKAVLNGKRKPKDHRNNKKTNNVEAVLPELPPNWTYYRLEDITFLITDGTHFTPKYQDNGVVFLSVKNVRPFYFRLDDVKYISEEEHHLLIERCHPQRNDILYTKVGATFGYAAKITMDYDFSIFVSLCLIKPVYEYLSSDFLEFLMNSELVFKQARKRVSGSGVPDLHLIEIRDFKIPLPSYEEQCQIVQELQCRLTVCDKIQETITQSLAKAETLRQSILKKAFEGKLIPQSSNSESKNYKPARA